MQIAPSGLAVLYDKDAYSFQNKVMGRQSAGIAFVKAVAAQAYDKIWCYAASRDGAVAFARDLAAAGAPRTGVSFVPYHEPQRLQEAGLLYRPDPVVGPEAWRRLTHAHPRAYSLCGVTHTTASHGAMEALTALVTAPVEPWDAVICTSRAVRDSVRVLLESTAEHLRERLGATRFTLPQLPVIPLGVHCDDYAPGVLGDKSAARAALGIGVDDVVALFVGRLSFHGKAHPLPMFLGLEAAARERPVTLVLAGWFGNDAIRDAFAADAQALCPSVTYRVVDGRDAATLRQAWAAADLFTSLSDSIQETFGLTPIEAMAAGLPVVVTDWDGYKDTVRDGIDGFRVPTLTPPSGQGGHFATRFDLGVDDYDRYCGHTGQFAAVNVPAASEAYTRLALDPDLRGRMGAAGRVRARAEFDWSVIFKRYQALWDDLTERRRSDPALSPPLTRRRRPERPDPFTVFASYPTAQIAPGTMFRRTGLGPAEIEARRRLKMIGFAEAMQPNAEIVARLLEAFDGGVEWRSAHDIGESLAEVARLTPARLNEALAWLCKLGALEFQITPPAQA